MRNQMLGMLTALMLIGPASAQEQPANYVVCFSGPGSFYLVGYCVNEKYCDMTKNYYSEIFPSGKGENVAAIRNNFETALRKQPGGQPGSAGGGYLYVNTDGCFPTAEKAALYGLAPWKERHPNNQLIR